MSELPDVIELGSEEEAQRLWIGATDAYGSAKRDLVALFESLDLGLRAAEILVMHKLQHVKGDFPATIQLQLETPESDVDVHRDAINIPNTLDFTAVLDLLSEDGLECVSPGMHRGWEDRRFSCIRSRRTARSALGVSLNGEQREHLLVLAAYRNRIFRTPPPLKVVPAQITGAWGALKKLVEGLL
jgi:hypothetical protein